MILGAIKSRKDFRDLKLGRVQEPILIPHSYETDISWLVPLWQDGFPMCGSHSGSHFKAILDYLELKSFLRYSPIYLWKKIKAIDFYAPEQGTDMRSIFKALLSRGVCDYVLLPTDYNESLANHSKDITTEEQDKNAHPRIISSYAFVSTDTDSLKQAIYQNKVVLARLDVGDTWWGKEEVLPFIRKDGGHFIILYGYDGAYFYALDSADKDVPEKKIVLRYKIKEAGTAVDLPNSVVRDLVKQKEILQKVVALYYKLINLLKK